ncbi:hypothetical protein [Brevibacillus sp. H7]|uniref:hypothetical protein n=1 Tax=Brevibacillus sp. H7 TaxID=3349138 RepID=UPI0038294F67
MQLTSEQLYVRGYKSEDAAPLLQLRLRNRDFFLPFEPIRPPSHYTLEAQQEFIAAAIRDFECGTGYGYGRTI